MVYGYKSKYAEPEPTEEVKVQEKRFVIPPLPKVTWIQAFLISLVIYFAFVARKKNGVVVGTLGLTIGLLHFYDHLFRIKRGPEQSLFASRKETYCGACKN